MAMSGVPETVHGQTSPSVHHRVTFEAFEAAAGLPGRQEIRQILGERTEME
jgi:hypothetical protein